MDESRTELDKYVQRLLQQPVSRRGFVTIATATAIAAAAAQAHPRRAYAAEGKIAIIHTNDVHCKLDVDEKLGTIGYAGVATLYKEAQAAYGSANAVLVDAGDNLQGQVSGAITEGLAPSTVMNALGYKYATLGNHDFDFGLQALLNIGKDAEYEILACNVFYKDEPEPVCKPYVINEYAGKKVAFLGITTPETLVKCNPKKLQDDTGQVVIGFKQDETGEALYECVQKAVDAARADGADYVVALGHLGQSGIANRWRSDVVVQNTSGIDVLIDGHSHEEYVRTVANKDGAEVIIAQTGTALHAVGRVVIDVATNAITAELIAAPVEQDPDTKKMVDSINEAVAKATGEVFARSDVDLAGVVDGEVQKVSRLRETNMGDFITDSYRLTMNTDIAFLGGGSIRSNMAAGDVAYSDILSVTPFFNSMAIVKASGQLILDALEMGAYKWPEPLGGFLQTSGLSYEIRTDIPTSVELDEAQGFVRVAGDRRVQNVRVAGEPIVKDRMYTIAGVDFLLINGGDGFTMWKNAEVVVSEGPTDCMATVEYIKKNLNGVIDAQYANKSGQGRIVFKDGPDPVGPDPTDPDPANPDPSNPDPKGKTVPKTGDAARYATVIAAGAAAVAMAVAGKAALAEDAEDGAE